MQFQFGDKWKMKEFIQMFCVCIFKNNLTYSNSCLIETFTLNSCCFRWIINNSEIELYNYLFFVWIDFTGSVFVVSCTSTLGSLVYAIVIGTLFPGRFPSILIFTHFLHVFWFLFRRQAKQGKRPAQQKPNAKEKEKNENSLH